MRTGGLAGFLVIIALVIFGGLLILNAAPQPAYQVILPTNLPATEENNSWSEVLRAGFGQQTTSLPTIAIPTGDFIPPTLVGSADTDAIVLAPDTVSEPVPDTSFSAAATPTLVAPTAPPMETDTAITALPVTSAPVAWQPPPLIPPLSRDPLGRDHFWFTRPVDSNAINYGLTYYPFGSDGPEDENPLRVHHGIDMANPVGESVRAAGSGTVVWASGTGLREEDGSGSFQNTPSYGNAVVIEHDFGYRGQPLYTLYAHLSAVLIERGAYVRAGDIIGLIGDTGRTSGPHVHFEVRVGENAYASTYNPALWMVPYVGRGVIAGRITDFRNELVQDLDITIRSFATGLVTATTTSYVYQDTGFDVNADPMWQENFVVGDIPVGRYEIIANVGGERVSKFIDVLEGTTNFVELSPIQSATAQSPDDAQATETTGN